MKEYETLIKELGFSMEFEKSIMQNMESEVMSAIEDPIDVDVEIDGVISTNNILCSTNNICIYRL